MARMKLLPTKSKKNTTDTVANAKKSATVRERVPGSRGWGGRGGGSASLVPAVREYRGTTVQVCGLWPFSSGRPRP